MEGADVWIVRAGSDDSRDAVAHVQSGARGKFEFPGHFVQDLTLNRTGNFSLLARQTSGRMGWYAIYYREESYGPFRIRLREEGELYGLVLAEDGHPLPGVRLEAHFMGSGTYRNRGTDRTVLPDFLKTQFSAVTNQEGTFRIPHLPQSGWVSLAVMAGDFGEFKLFTDLGRPLELRLTRSASIHGRLNVPSPDAVKECKLLVRHEKPPEKQPALYGTFVSNTFKPQADGRFTVSGVPPGSYMVLPQFPDESRYYARRVPGLELKSSQNTADLEIRIFESVLVRGRVVEHVSGEPVSGVKVKLTRVEADQSLVQSRNVETDAQGRFAAFMPPGGLTLRVTDVPLDFLPEDSLGSSQAFVKEQETELADVRIHRAARLDLVIVDEQGRPVPGAEIRVELQLPGRPRMPIFSGPDSRATFTQLDPTRIARVRTRTATAISDGYADLAVGEGQTPVRMTLLKEAASFIRARVVDKSDRPVVDAEASIMWRRTLPDSAIVATRFPPARTDYDGRLSIGPVWHGDHCQIQIDAEGFKSYSLPLVQAERGATYDLGTIRLTPIDRELAGLVVDSSGQPVSGVRVFSAGDSAEPVSAGSDGDGRFRPVGLPDGNLFLFASSEEFRFDGARVNAGQPEARLVLWRDDERSPESKRLGAYSHPPVDRAELKRLLTMLYSRRDPSWAKIRVFRAADDDLSNPLERIARLAVRLDPDLAREWSRNDRDFSPLFHREMAAHIGLQDLEETFARLREITPEAACRVLCELAASWPADDRQELDRLAEESAALAPNIKPPLDAVALAQTASIALRAGHEEQARQLFSLAAKKAEGLHSGGASGNRDRHLVAHELVAVDFDAALAVVDPIQNPTARNHAIVGVIAAVARREPDRAPDAAERLLKGDPQTYNFALLTIAWEVADNDPDRAIGIVRGMDISRTSKPLAEALGWMAVAVAPTDRSRAWTLIDEAVAVYERQKDESLVWTNFGGRSGMAARIVNQAAEVGYVDLRSLVYRTLAMRPAAADYADAITMVKSAVSTALILASTDPETAG